MDLTPYILSSIGALAIALGWVAFFRPTDYLEVFFPMMKVINMVGSGILAGITIGVMYSVDQLSPPLDLVPAAPALLSKVRNFSNYAFVVFIIYSLADILLWYIAVTMRSRQQGAEAAEP